MKQFSFLKGLFFFLAAGIILTSCEDDGTGGGGGFANPPILQLLDNGNGSVTNDVQVASGTTLTFSVDALSGDSPMNNIRLLEDGVLVTDYASRIMIDGVAASTANILLFNDDKTSFTKEITWITHADASSKTYAIEVVDEAGNSDSEAVIVNTVPQTVLALAFVPGGDTGNSISTDGTYTADSFIRVTLQATRGAYPLTFLEVQEDGTAISDLSRLYFSDIASGNQWDANPYALPSTAEDGFEQDVLVKIHAEEGVTKTYSFLLSDGNGDFEFVQLMITTPQALPDITTHIGVLFNKAGPAGTGGLDLETATGTGSADPTADIADLGIDPSAPVDNNWYQKFEPVNGATLKLVPSSAEFPTTFDEIQYQSEIADAYALGTTVAESFTVNVGDVYLVSDAAGEIFILKCTNVNVTSETTAPLANGDSYTFDIKF